MAAAMLSVAGTASAATPAQTTLTIRDSASLVKAGGSVTISGTLSEGHTVLGDETVWLDTVGPGGVLQAHLGWDKPTAVKTGVVTFTITPHASATYELVFHGARGLASSHSGAARVTVAKLPTALSISTATTPVTIGTEETFSGTLTSAGKPLGGRSVELWVLDSRKDRIGVAGHGTTSATGAVSIITTPPLGTDYYALVYGGDWKYGRAVSAIDKVTVTRIATTLTLSSSATAPVAKGTKVTLTATLTAGTKPLNGKTIQLQVLVKGVWVNAVAGSNSTGLNGKVTFTRAPSVTTSYRVVYAGGADYTRAASSTVVVTIS